MLLIIPARRGSNRLPGKNVRTFEVVNGVRQNLVEHTVNHAKWLDGKIVVSTDIPPRDVFKSVVVPETDFSACPEVYDLVGGGKLYYVNRANKGHLNSPDTRTEDVIEDVLRTHEDESFCLLQPTSPIRDRKTLLHAQRLFLNDNMSALISVDMNFRPNGNFYFVRSKDFLEQRTVYVRNSCYFVCCGPLNIDVDYIHDFRIAQAVNENRIFRGD